MRGRLAIVLAVTVSAVVGLAACAPASQPGSGAEDSSSASTTAAGGSEQFVVLPIEGTVSGLLRMYGGPMNPTTGKAALNGEPQPHSDVAIVSATGRKTETTTDRSGRFTFLLAPGSYRLACNGTHTLVLRPGAAIDADCVLDVP